MKTVLITGASRGIGKALAERFLENGDFVIGTSTTGKADWNHENFTVFQLDLFNSESIKKCVDQVSSLGKKIDVLINNAGMVVEEEAESPIVNIVFLRKTLEANLIGTIDTTEQVITHMNSGGHIVNISSRAGSLGSKEYTLNYPAYRISKAGLNMFTRILAVRLEGEMIVSSVHPGWVKTDMGGDEAEVTPKEAAEHIFKLATSKVESGNFWFMGEKYPW
ncbi:MAG: SDR family NAD(P)-dependent oxidoreductase [Minisyncoccia bacterium]